MDAFLPHCTDLSRRGDLDLLRFQLSPDGSLAFASVGEGTAAYLAYVKSLTRAALERQLVPTVNPSRRLLTERSDAPKLGRNEPCPCGSGKKYKKCHGT